MKPLEIIKTVGIFSLWDNQGSCPCGDFQVGGVKVEFDCWRTANVPSGEPGSLITVCQHWDLGLPENELQAIAEECRNQVREVWNNTDWHINIESPDHYAQ